MVRQAVLDEFPFHFLFGFWSRFLTVFREGQVDLQPSNNFALYTALLGSLAPSHQQCQIASSSPQTQHEIPITLQGKLFILNQFSQKKKTLISM
jgi:hypothetical protein